MTKRFVLPNGLIDDVADAVAQAHSLWSSAPHEVTELLFVVPTIKGVEDGILAAVLGSAAIREMKKDGAHQIGPLTVRMTSRLSPSYVGKNTVVLGCFADKAMMDSIDALNQARAVIAIPHIPNAVEIWANAWGPTLIGRGASSVAPPAVSLISDPVVEKAMHDIATTVNASGSSFGARDDEYVTEVLKVLRYVGHHREDTANMRAWLVREKWSPKLADTLQRKASNAFDAASKPRGIPAETIERLSKRWGL